jgi:hypothetical protein
VASVREEPRAMLFYGGFGVGAMGARLRGAGIMAIAGGLLMLLSGYASRSLLYILLPYLQAEITSYLSGSAQLAAFFAIVLLAGLLALGGIAVIGGGFVLLFTHVTAGRLLIYLGGGAGLLGLLASLGYAVYRLGVSHVIYYAPYWLGLAMAVGARRLSKGS